MQDKFMGVRVLINSQGFNTAFFAMDFVEQCKAAKFKIRYLKITGPLYRELRAKGLMQ